MKLKWQDATTNLKEGLKCKEITRKKVKKLTMTASEYVDKQELSCLVGWNAKCTAFLEKNLAVNHQVNHTLNIQSNNPTWKYLPKWNDNPYSHKNWT